MSDEVCKVVLKRDGKVVLKSRSRDYWRYNGLGCYTVKGKKSSQVVSRRES